MTNDRYETWTKKDTICKDDFRKHPRKAKIPLINLNYITFNSFVDS